jgi:PAS domain S-box-containing protein
MSTHTSLWASAVQPFRRGLTSVRKRAATLPLPESLTSSFRNLREALRRDPEHLKRFVLQPAASLLCAGIVFGAGLLGLVVESRWSTMLTRASYDWSYALGQATTNAETPEVVIVYVDPKYVTDLGKSSTQPVDRSLHARLLRRLQADSARATVLDVVFDGPGLHYEADEELTSAIRANGHVILAQDLNNGEVVNGSERKGLEPLYPPFARVAVAKGLDLLQPDSDFMVRKHTHSFEEIQDTPPSLSWVAAQMSLKTPRDPAEQNAERWVYYYGPPDALPHLSAEQALASSSGYFRDKTVFIGTHPMKSAFMEKRDELRTPFNVNAGSSSSRALMPTVEMRATEFLNLVRGDWLRRPSMSTEVLVLALTALIFSFALLRFPPFLASGLAAAGGLGFICVTQVVFRTHHIWFAWLIPVAVQIPLALFFSIISHSLGWIAQQRKQQEESRRADLRIREQAALLDRAQDAIIVHDLEWRVQYWNKSAERLYGWSFDEVKGKDLRPEIFQTAKSEFLTAFEQTLAKGEWAGELAQLTKQREELAIQSRWTLVRDDEGKPKGIFVINTNVTEQKRLEAQFLRTQRVESIGTLASGIAHDLNNVLSPILMGVQLLKNRPQDDSGRKMLSTMESSAQRAADMIRQVLAFGRGQEGRHKLVYFKQILPDMQKIIADTFPKNIDVQVDMEDTHPVLGDATQIHQILLNLCVNARDAMPNGGRMVLSAKNLSISKVQAARFINAKAGEYVLLCVADNGSGIPRKIMHRIFEPFFTTKEIGKGTGLGLSTVMAIVKTHGGFLDVQSEPGKGTTFNVYLPRAEILDRLEHAIGPAKSLRGKGETVMIVDDDPAVLEVTTGLLTHYGYKVVTAKNGADAIAVYAHHRDLIKIVIMDMMMPVMDGATAIKALKREEPALQVVATSGLPAGEKLKDIGFEIPFLQKPCPSEKLLEQIKRLLCPVTA